MKRSRCKTCGHPGGVNRQVTATVKSARGRAEARQHKKPCDCDCHRPKEAA